MLSKFDKILLDVSGTLYSNKKEPLNGSKEFLKNYYQKIIIFSNIGSKTGLELKEELFNIFNVQAELLLPPPRPLPIGILLSPTIL